MAVRSFDLIAARGTPSPLADGFARPITYLRISVTDRCDLRCVYCMPEAGLAWIPRDDILTFDEIVRVVEAGASVGVRSIRLTGGEPLVRPGLLELVARIRAVPGIEEVALSTNGTRLAEHAHGLSAAGLTRVNVSLDTLRADRFVAIARRDGLARVLAGIEAAIDAGLAPVKINVVAMRGVNDDEFPAFAELARTRPVAVRFIELMPVHENVAIQADRYISASEITERLRAEDPRFAPVDGPGGNGPARYYGTPGMLGSVGVISPLSHDYCDRCNRVRLTADGRLRLCLFGDQAIDLRTPLRAGDSCERIAARLQGAMAIKPERHHLRIGETSSSLRAFSQIGG